MAIDPKDQARRRALVLGCLALGAAWALPARAAAKAGPAPAQLRIGFQKAAVNLVILKQQGALEKRFPDSKVSWLEFPAGPQLLEALSVGALEFGLTGDSPPVFAQAAEKDLFYVGAEPPKPQSSAILVKPDSSIRVLADLKGRKVAVQKGSSAHFLLVRALEEARLEWSDITAVYLPPADARAAFERDSVDAWAIWDPYYAAAELDARPRVLHNGVGLSGNNSFYLASRQLVERHPATVLGLLQALTEADAYVQGHRKESAQLVSEFSGLSLATVFRFIERRPPSPTRPLWPSIVENQQRVADSFFRLGLIPRRIKVADIVWKPQA
ncbi:MAG: sulfonate ABC transporter substrate-binding protein [Aquabacterium sp.]|nr:MAG: sulfonate ABC transporter substrate-binding protein [Aquabacterium sp.]